MLDRLNTTILLALAISIAGDALGDESKKVFDSLFGAQIKQAQATADPKDDIALAEELLQKAGDTKDPGLLAAMCDAVWNLAGKRDAGLAMAASAMQLLIERAPDRADESLDRLVEIRQRQYNTARADAKQPAATALVDALLAASRRKAAAGDDAGESAALRRALPVARAAKLEQSESIRIRLDLAQHKTTTRQRIARLEAQLNDGPSPKVGEEITLAYLVDLDNPVDASSFAQVSGNDALKRIAALAGKATATLTEQECLDLGTWYQKASTTAAAAARPAMLVRAHAPLRRYLALHPAKDLPRSQAELTLKEVDEKLKALGIEAPDAPAGTTSTATAAVPFAKVKLPDNLLKLVDPKEDPVYGPWKIGDGVVTSPSQGAPYFPALLTVPVAPLGDYKLEVRFIRRQGNNSANIFIPVGSTYAMVVLDGFMEQGGFSGIEMIDGVQCDKNATRQPGKRLVNDREHVVEASVTATEKEASISVTLDGKALAKWSGNPASLGVHEQWWRSPDKRLIALGSWWSSFEFTSVRLTMLTGEARPVFRMPLLMESRGEKGPLKPIVPLPVDFNTHEFFQTQAVGTGKDMTFRARSEAGRPMIGMRFQVSPKHGNHISAVAIINVDATGQNAALAEWCGTPDEKLGFNQVIAPGGFAIGAVTLRGGERVHGIKLTFMRWAGDKLDPTQQFETRWFGGFGDGKEITLGGDGKIVVGLHGRAGDGIENLGLVQIRRKGDALK